MIGQAEVVVQTPHQHFLAAEGHVCAEFAFQLREGKVAVCLLGVAADGAGVFADLVEYVVHG
jgi:hypothetical protein